VTSPVTNGPPEADGLVDGELDGELDGDDEGELLGELDGDELGEAEGLPPVEYSIYNFGALAVSPSHISKLLFVVSL